MSFATLVTSVAPERHVQILAGFIKHDWSYMKAQAEEEEQRQQRGKPQQHGKAQQLGQKMVCRGKPQNAPRLCPARMAQLMQTIPPQYEKERKALQKLHLDNESFIESLKRPSARDRRVMKMMEKKSTGSKKAKASASGRSARARRVVMKKTVQKMSKSKAAKGVKTPQSKKPRAKAKASATAMHKAGATAVRKATTKKGSAKQGSAKKGVLSKWKGCCRSLAKRTGRDY